MDGIRTGNQGPLFFQGIDVSRQPLANQQQIASSEAAAKRTLPPLPTAEESGSAERSSAPARAGGSHAGVVATKEALANESMKMACAFLLQQR